MLYRALVLSLLLWPMGAQAFFFEDVAPLLELVSGQVQEIQRLADNVDLARDQLEFLRTLNDGINKTVDQISSLQIIMERSQGLDPRSVRSLSDLNDLLEEARATQGMVEELMDLKVALADQAIERTAMQSETAYLMGQEMVSTGSHLAVESQSASPGRAAQISAAAGSAQMLSQGVQLQTLAQMAELQALLLEFQKAQVQRELQSQLIHREHLVRHLSKQAKRPSQRGRS